MKIGKKENGKMYYKKETVSDELFRNIYSSCVVRTNNKSQKSGMLKCFQVLRNLYSLCHYILDL